MRKSKYGNKKTTIDGFVFDSKREATRYQQLKLIVRAGVISDLTLQPSYMLQESFKINGKTIRAIKYVADFKYVENGVTIVEDVKGCLTDVYKLKKKLFLFKYGNELEFREIF